MIYGLSCTCHPEVGIRYVGQTQQSLATRLTNHRAQARFGTVSPVYHWIRKHGPENIQIEFICTPAPGESLDDCERRVIASTPNILNVAVGGVDGTTLGRKRPEFSLMIRGEGHPGAVLNEGEVIRIRSEYTGRRGQIKTFAKEIGVSDAAVSDALTGKTWSHLPLGEVVPKKRRRLTADEVAAIRQLRVSDTPVREIALRFGVTETNIYHILKGSTWN